ncbi:MAG: AMP-binding protein [Microthrixaceae bacterium]
MLLQDIVDNAAATLPERPALVHGQTRWTFAELAQRVHTLAQRIRELTEPAGRVAVLSSNTAAYVAALYAVPAAGRVLVHCNTRHTAQEVTATIERSGAELLLGSEDELDRLAHVPAPTLRHRMVLDNEVLDNEVPVNSPTAHSEDSTPTGAEDDTAWLMYTSGTTGTPKGVMLTHRSLIAAVLNTTMGRPVSEDEVYLYPFPLFHIAAYNVLHLHMRRRPVVLLGSFEPQAVLDAIADEAVTSVSLAPTMLAMLLDHPTRDDSRLVSLRTVTYGAAAMPLELLRRSLAEWPDVGLAQGYGMTELSGNAVFLSPADHRLAATTRPDLLSAAGRPGPLVRLRIESDAGTGAAPGEPGEILVRGDQVCAGYLDDPDESARSITDGWLHTGDIGRMDADGYLHVVDRLKDIIITGGENVSSREVEDVLSLHPDVESVAVVGTPDERWGELVTAVVVPRPGRAPSLESLRAACGTLAGFKHPRRVVVVEDLPTNASGKLDKVAVRKLARQP